MKYLILSAALLYAAIAPAQTAPSYHDWLKAIKEIPVKDSVHITVPEQLPAAEDPENIRKYITPLYSPDEQQVKSPFSYYVTGKITSNPDYDILLLYKLKHYSDSMVFRSLYLVTMDKQTGRQLHFQMVADNSVYRKDKSISNSRFFKNGLLKVDTKRIIRGKELLHLMEFTINNWGTIVAKSKWAAGAEKHEH